MHLQLAAGLQILRSSLRAIWRLTAAIRIFSSVGIYVTLFFTALISATIVPLSSEVIFATVIALGYDPVLTIVVAGVGNCLGVTTNYVLGLTGIAWLIERWFKFDRARLETFAQNHRRYGMWFMLASWLPVIGDPITIYAGIVRYPFWKFAAYVYSTRIARYVVIYFIIVEYHRLRS